MAPVADSKIFLTSGGSDSVDTAAKLARRYFHEIGQPERTVILTRTWAYHGMHAYGTALAGIGANRDALGELIQDIEVVQWDSADALEEAIQRIGPNRIAAFFCEPVVGAGGVRFAPDGYLTRVREIIREAGAFFVSDEVITGFGRTGDWFASDRFGLDPDLLTFAKGVTSGYIPLGGVIAAPHVPSRSGGRGPESGGVTATRTPGIPRHARLRSRTSTSSSARASTPGPAAWKDRSATRSRTCSITRLCPKFAPARAFLPPFRSTRPRSRPTPPCPAGPRRRAATSAP